MKLQSIERDSMKKFELEEAITVRELIDLLLTFDQDLPIGRVGHFGEFNKMNNHNFYVRETYSTKNLWRDEGKKSHKCVDVSTPDIGPDPD